jgi:hypothetical protein
MQEGAKMKIMIAEAAFLLAALISYAAPQSSTGLIEGTVIDEKGKPVRRATVYAQPTDRGMAMKVPCADTDETGHFAIHHLWWGEFGVFAKKEDEDYPDMSFQFYSNGRYAAVTLSARHPAATAMVQLGPKAGVLVGTVTDAATGAPLNPCVYFKRASDPNNFLSGTGVVNAKYRVLVPSNTDVAMKISLEGYKPWYYPGTPDKSASTPVRLQPAQEQTLDIRLQPGSVPDEEGCGPLVNTAEPPSLRGRIPPPEPGKYSAIRDAKNWMNPFLVIHPNGIEVLAKGADSEGPILRAYSATLFLRELPAGGWPYGLVVAVVDAGLLGGTDDLPRIRRNRAELLHLLRKLGVKVELWPSG